MIREAENFKRELLKDTLYIENWELKNISGRPLYTAKMKVNNITKCFGTKELSDINLYKISYNAMGKERFITYRDKLYILVEPFNFEFEPREEYLNIDLKELFSKYIEHSNLDDYILAFLIGVCGIKEKIFIHLNASTGFGKTGIFDLIKNLVIDKKIYLAHIRTYAKFRNALNNHLIVADEIHRLDNDHLEQIQKLLLNVADHKNEYYLDAELGQECIDISQLSIILLSNDISIEDYYNRIYRDIQLRFLDVKLAGKLQFIKKTLTREDYFKLFNFVNTAIRLNYDKIHIETEDARQQQNLINLLSFFKALKEHSKYFETYYFYLMEKFYNIIKNKEGLE